MAKEQQSSSTPYKPKDLLDEKEAAGYLKLAPATLRNWRVKGYGPKALRVGKRARRYRFAEIEAFIAGAGEVSA